MRVLAWLSLLIVLLAGCKDMPDENDLVERMLVQTTYDENTAFSIYNSFTLSLDTLGLYANWTEDTLFVSNYSKQVTAKIKDEMVAAGYQFVAKDQDPDLGFAATVFDNYNVYQQISYPTYYNGYYGFGYGGYYGPIVTTYANSSSTLVIHLIDLKNRDAENRLKVIWKAYIGDLARSSNTNQKTLDAILQAFNQSPYLAKP